VFLQKYAAIDERIPIMNNHPKGFRIKDVFRNMGIRSVIAPMLVFLLTVVMTCIGSYQYYKATREEIYLQGRVNAVESARNTTRISSCGRIRLFLPPMLWMR
jgi:hypothetical protein